MSEPLSGVVVALDDAPFDDLIGAVEVMVQQGLRAFAFHTATLDLADWVAIFGARARIGVHRVGTTEQAASAVADGATFVLPDIVDDALIEACGDAAVYPPAMTPAEVRDVLRRPVTGAQVYPADVLGPNYAEALGDLGLADRALPRRALGAYAVGRWFAAGAKAVVVDDQVLGDALTGGDLGQLRERCAAFVEVQPR